MTKIFDLICVYCDNEFKSTVILNNFCCKACQDDYYKIPEEERKLTITTKCPTCHEQYTREIDYTEMRFYQALCMCDKCSTNVMIGNNKVWQTALEKK